ncbi:unnamed protein product [Citrullus colocynthis]|uniref:Uncharacterized protein n=1 Tax=Citrullus colocynthis TaxID=252529 RepID=A0ABP0YSJ7_9ROSI
MVQTKKENVEASSLLILNNWRYLFERSFLYMYHNPGQFLGDSMNLLQIGRHSGKLKFTSMVYLKKREAAPNQLISFTTECRSR